MLGLLVPIDFDHLFSKHGGMYLLLCACYSLWSRIVQLYHDVYDKLSHLRSLSRTSVACNTDEVTSPSSYHLPYNAYIQFQLYWKELIVLYSREVYIIVLQRMWMPKTRFVIVVDSMAGNATRFPRSCGTQEICGTPCGVIELKWC